MIYHSNDRQACFKDKKKLSCIFNIGFISMINFEKVILRVVLIPQKEFSC